jgi:predicted dehydrogenase
VNTNGHVQGNGGIRRGWNVAVIGCGYWGVNYLRILDELPQVTSVIACDAREERLKEIRQKNPRISTVSGLDRLLGGGSIDIDAAVVATPAETHVEVTSRLLEAGVHVLVEKPITIRSEDAVRLTESADDKGLTLAVGHTFLHHPAIRKMKALVDEGRLGRPHYVYSRRTNLGPIRTDVNAVWDLAPHDVAIFNHLLGAEPIWVSAVGGRMLRNSRDDVGFVTLGYADGIIAHIQVSWVDPHKVRELVLVGTDSRIVFDDLKPGEHIRVHEKGVAAISGDSDSFGEHQWEIRDGDILSPKIEPSEPLKNQVIDFLESVATGRPPISGGVDGAAVVRVMEAIDLSIAGRGTPILVGQGTRLEPVTIDLRDAASVAIEHTHQARVS